jgi:poly-gamma-glutamate synthesis protein (capsule biosynthesis protein)
MAPKPGQDAQLWSRRRRELFGFEPDPEYPTYPFHPEAKYTVIAKCVVTEGKISRMSYLPCLVNKKSQPEILKHDARGQEVFDYVERVTQGTALNACYRWEGDEVVVTPK